MTSLDALLVINRLGTDPGRQAYYQWKLTNVRVTSYSVNGSSG